MPQVDYVLFPVINSEAVISSIKETEDNHILKALDKSNLCRLATTLVVWQ